MPDKTLTKRGFDVLGFVHLYDETYRQSKRSLAWSLFWGLIPDKTSRLRQVLSRFQPAPDKTPKPKTSVTLDGVDL